MSLWWERTTLIWEMPEDLMFSKRYENVKLD